MKDLSGFWAGQYFYGDSRPPVDFDIELTHIASKLSGIITEPNSFEPTGGALLSADITGSLAGSVVKFIKSYKGGHDVRYVGQLSPEGDVITGDWTIISYGGSFTMRRDLGREAEIKDLRRVVVDEDV